MMNSNFFHNVANWAIVGISAVEVVAMGTGCTDSDPGPAVVLECSRSFLPPQIAFLAVGGIATAKSLINIVRDGWAGLFKQQPPVVATLPVVPVQMVPADKPATVTMEVRPTVTAKSKNYRGR